MALSRGLSSLLQTAFRARISTLTSPSASTPICLNSRRYASENTKQSACRSHRRQRRANLTTPSRSLSCQQRRHATSTSQSSDLKRTPLYDVHAEAGAKMGPFAGFSMPLEYPGQSHLESHKWTRENASLFDVSHMVQHKLSGPLAEEFLMTITPTSIDELAKHSSTLSCLLNSEGGIVDDTVITRIGRDSFYFVTNAGCRDTDLPFIESSMKSFLESKGADSDQICWHILDHHALVALQGPKAVEILQAMVFQDPEDPELDVDLSTMSFGRSRWLQLSLPDGMNTPSLLISRTGYTGEDGFEISIPPENGDASKLAASLAKAFIGDESAVRWAGLAARDSLRLEAGMCLYGHDIDTKTTPPMAALGWIVSKPRRSENSTPKFNGQSVILAQLADPKIMPVRRVGFILEKGPAAREGADIVDPDNNDKVVGRITSGCPAPSMAGTNIAMGLIQNGWHKKGTKVGIRVRKSVRKAEVAKMPFVDSKFYRAEKQ